MSTGPTTSGQSDKQSYPNAPGKNWWKYILPLVMLLAVLGTLLVANNASAGIPTKQQGLNSVTSQAKTDVKGQPQKSSPNSGAGTKVQLAPPQAPYAILYDQYDNIATSGTVSQDFEAALDAYDSQTADDFVVPSGQTWTVNEVDARGVYFNGPGPAVSFNVYFYQNSGALPATPVYTATGLAYTGSSDFVIPLTSPAVLPAGTYWLSVQARQDFTPNGEFGWEDRTVQSNSPAAWRNPGGGFACAAGNGWNPKQVCVTTAAIDNVFRLVGTSSGGGATNTPVASPTATPTSCATNYDFTLAAGGFITGTTRIDGVGCDDCTTAATIPFSVSIYGTSYNAATVGSNGILAFGTAGNAFSGSCIPVAGATNQLMPFYRDQRTDCTGGCGIYTITTGTAPNRVFTVEYRTIYFGEASTVPTLNYGVNLYESGSPAFEFTYLLINATTQTGRITSIGVQQNGTVFRQYACDTTGQTPPVSSGQRIIWTLATCTTGTATTTPVAPTATATPCSTDAFTNGGFETGTFAPWVIRDSQPAPFVDTSQAHTGTFSAFLGSPVGGGETPGDSSIYQTITVPAGGGTLSYWYRPASVDSITFDWQDAYVTDTSGTILATIMHVCQNTQAWTNVTYNMSAFAGQTVRIEFLVHGDNAGDPTSMNVDDVSLGGGSCGSPVATATPTACVPLAVGPDSIGAWSSGAPISIDQYGGSSASDGTYLYVGGGYSFSGGGQVTQFGRYDPVANSWTSLAPMPDLTNGLASAVWAPNVNKLFVFGGDDATSGVVVNLTRIYDPGTDTWTLGTPMPDLRAFMASGYYNGKIYLVGGYSTGNINPAYGQVWEYDPTTDTFNTSRTDMPAHLGGAGFGVINGHLYVAGGRDENNIVVSTLYDYNIATDTWTTKASMPSADNVPASGVAAGQLVVYGGGNPFLAGSQKSLKAFDAPQTTNQTMIYDPGTDTWTAGPNLVQQVAFPSGTNIDDSYLVAVGGYTGSSTTTAVQVSTISGGGGGCPTNTPVVTATSTPCQAQALAPWVAAAPHPLHLVRYGFATVGNVNYTFGGVDNGAQTNAVYKFDAGTNTWTPLAAMPFAGEGPTCAYNTNGKVYCTAGTAGNGFASYDIGTDTWTPLASIPAADTYGSASASMGDNVYVVGGGSGGPSTGTYVYSISGGSWTSGNAAPSPYLLGAYNIAGNYLYLVGSYGASPLSGGHSASSILNGARGAGIAAPDANSTAVQRLDLTAGTWSTGPTWTQSRADAGLAYDPASNTLYFLGGDANNGGYFDSTALVDEYTLSSWPGGAFVASTPNLPSQRQAGEGGFYTTAMAGGEIWSTGGIDGTTFTFLNENLYRAQAGGGCGGGTPTNTPVATATCQAGGTPGPFTVVSPLPFAARGIAVASDGTYTYMNGGYDGTNIHNDTLRYDPVTDTYTTLAPSPDQHFLGQGVYDNGKFYVLGGFDASGGTPTNLTRIYDIGSNTWSTGANIPVALTDHAVAIYNGIIYVASGYNGGSETSGLYAYNIAGNSWTTLASMPQALYLPGIGAINGKLYVAGGATSSQADLNTNYIYDIASDTWSSGAVLPTGVTSPASAVVNGQLWIMGGGFNVLGTGAAGSENKGQKPASPDTTTLTQVYDPGTDTWSSGPPLNVARLWFYGTLNGNTVVVPGGDTSPGIPTNTNEIAVGTGGCTATPTPTATCQAGGGPFDVLIVSSDLGVPPSTLQSQLQAEPGINSVSLYDAEFNTPTLSDLQQYDAVVVFSNSPFADAVTLGDELADYQDGGGMVTGLQFDWYGSPFGLDGRWITGGYSPFQSPDGFLSGSATEATCTFGPICAGVSGLTSNFWGSMTLNAGAQSIGTWNDNTDLAAYKLTGSTTAFAVNAYVGDGAPGWSGNYGHFIANAINWALGSGGCGGGTPTVTPTPTATICVSSASIAPWTSGAPITTDHYGGSSASDGTYLYVGGGYSFSGGGQITQFGRYDPVANSWTYLAPMPDLTNGLASAVWAPNVNKLFVFGGDDATSGTVVNTTRIYDPGTDTWSTGTAMPDVRAFMASGYYNGKIYLVGGYSTGNVNPAFGQVWEYDPTTDTFNTSRTDMPALLGGAGYGVINGHLYVAGGRDENNIVVSTLYDYDIATDTWASKANMPSADNVPASGVAAGQLVVYGGGNPFSAAAKGQKATDKPTLTKSLRSFDAPETTAQTMIYDPGTDTWTSGPSLLTGVAFPSGTNIDDSYLVAVGGYDGSSTTTAVQVSTISGGGGGCPTNTPVVTDTPTATATVCLALPLAPWTAAAPHPLHLVRYGFATVGNVNYTFGGVDNGAQTNAVYKFDAGTNTWTPLAAMPFAGEGPTCAYNTNGKVYCTAGTAGNGFASYDIGTDTWTPLASIPAADTYGSASASMGDNVYVVGGGSGGPSTGTYVYSISGGSWTSGNAAPSPYLLGAYNIAGNYLYLVGSYGASPLSGGHSASSILNGAKGASIAAPDANSTAVQRLDLTAGTWSTGPTWTQGRADAGLAYDPASNTLYFLGGDANNGGYFDSTALVDEYTLSSWPGGAFVASTPNLPSQRQAGEGGFYTTAMAGGEIWSTGGIDGTTFTFLNENLYRAQAGGCPSTNTPVPSTDTPVPPTDTPVPPTDTAVPPTDTAVVTGTPPTDTPTAGSPTETPTACTLLRGRAAGQHLLRIHPVSGLPGHHQRLPMRWPR